MKRFLFGFMMLVIVAAAAFWFLSTPERLSAQALPVRHIPDPVNGERLFHLGGCLSCHAPAGQALPSGGAPLRTPVGIFHPPNITPDPGTGIGSWSALDFVNAMMRGVDPAGRHLFPAFPYTSYARMSVEDVLDIKAYLDGLEPVSNPARAAELAGPEALAPLLRRGVGLWKRVAFAPAAYVPDPGRDPQWNAGAYLVAGAGHCGECHTPRNWMMAMDESRWLAGGPHPEGVGNVPSLRGLLARERYEDAEDLALAFEWGETFGYDRMSSGGMGSVQANLAKLPAQDRAAIAAYLTTLD